MEALDTGYGVPLSLTSLFFVLFSLFLFIIPSLGQTRTLSDLNSRLGAYSEPTGSYNTPRMA